VSRSGKEILDEGEYGWFLLERLEDGLMEIADVIELRDNHLGVFSRRIALKLFEVGTVAEGLFKKIVEDALLEQSNVNPNDLKKARQTYPFPDIRNFKRVLEPVFELSKRSVIFHYFKFAEEFNPFSSFANDDVTKDVGISPPWWVAYNEVKHDFFRNTEKATLGRLMEGVSAVFLLTVSCPAYWPVLALNNRFVWRRPREITTAAIMAEQFYETLVKTHFGEKAVGARAYKIGPPLNEIFANSRMFSASLAAFNPDTKRWEIPR